MDIVKLSLIELKALAYELIEQRENAQANLNAVSQEISKRRETEAKVAKVDK